MEERSLLDHMKIASPCSVDWEQMTGDESTRFCQQCRLSVYNISDMSSTEAESLLLAGREKGQRVCVRFFKRADGTVVTQDCPVGLRKLRDFWLQTVSRVAACTLWLFACASAHADNDTKVGQQSTPATQSNSLFKKPFPTFGKKKYSLGEVEAQQNKSTSTADKPPRSQGEKLALPPPTMGMVCLEPPALTAAKTAVTKQLQSNWRSPESKDTLAPVVLRFTVLKGGAISNLVVSKSSGSKSIDDKAMDAARRAAPFTDASILENSPFSMDISFDVKPKAKTSLPDQPH